MNKKLERLNSTLAREIARTLQHDSKNKVFNSITVTAAEVAPDLGSARIYYTFLGDYERSFVEEELKKASGFFRSSLANKLDVRHTPELRFQFDESVEKGTNIERILNEINNK